MNIGVIREGDGTDSRVALTPAVALVHAVFSWSAPLPLWGRSFAQGLGIAAAFFVFGFALTMTPVPGPSSPFLPLPLMLRSSGMSGPCRRHPPRSGHLRARDVQPATTGATRHGVPGVRGRSTGQYRSATRANGDHTRPPPAATAPFAENRGPLRSR